MVVVVVEEEVVVVDVVVVLAAAAASMSNKLPEPPSTTAAGGRGVDEDPKHESWNPLGVNGCAAGSSATGGKGGGTNCAEARRRAAVE